MGFGEVADAFSDQPSDFETLRSLRRQKKPMKWGPALQQTGNGLKIRGWVRLTSHTGSTSNPSPDHPHPNGKGH